MKYSAFKKNNLFNLIISAKFYPYINQFIGWIAGVIQATTNNTSRRRVVNEFFSFQFPNHLAT
jgi:hypothetical protein